MLAIPTCFETALAGERPNILFLAIDDQNDWVGPLGGHALAQTPHMDQLAKRGMVFTNAHCQAPLCNPSRTSLMLGLRPTSTGIYGLAPWFRTVDHLRDYRTLPQTLHRHGYRTFAAGKIFHGEMGRTGSDEPEFDVWGPSSTIGATPQHKLIPPTPDGNHPLMDWGVFPHRDEEKGDYQIASWAIETLHTMPAEQPFFLAAGFFLPHVPCYVTKRWIDLYPDDDSVLPMVLENDRSDTPPFSWYLHWRLPEPRLDWLTENNQWRNLVRSYLASTSFVDAQIGRVLAALGNSPFAANTIVVLWSDHGWHLGEKSITGKNTLWERSTRVPLIFVGPGIQPNSRCSEPVELLDIYPTLLTMCGLPSKPHLEGHSLAPQLANPEASRAWPAITSHNKGNHAIRTRDWRYIRYANGSEELYDEKSDPREELNLVGQPKYADTIQELRQYLPKVDRDPAPGSAHRVLTYDPTTKQAIWEGTVIEDRP